MLRRSRLHNLSNRRLCRSNLPSSSSSNSNSPSSHRATIIAATSISIALSSSSSTNPSSNSISGRSTRSTSSLKASMEVEGRIISSLSSTSSSTTTDSSSSSSTCSISRGSRARRRTTSKCPCLTSNLSPTAIMALTKRRIQALIHSPNLQTKIARLSQLTRPSERISERKGEGGKSGEKENALLEKEERVEKR